MRIVIIALGVLVMVAGIALADGSCGYQGKEYLNGSDLCQEGTRYRCENSVWQQLSVPMRPRVAFLRSGVRVSGTVVPVGQGQLPIRDTAALRERRVAVFGYAVW
jgi:hypothetical protein